jgi:uncharacterized membrane-anchored protein
VQNKVAEITIYFWVLKIIATTLGETADDMFSMTLDMGYINSLFLTGAILLIIMFFQIRAEKFHSLLFWGAIVGTTTVGTEISDMMDRTFHFGYFFGSAVLISCLLTTLIIWYMKEQSLLVYPIKKRSKEIMFWIAVLSSNSLGTAFGDFLTDNLNLTYIMGALVTSSIIVIVLLLHYATKINESVLFWIAFIFTRPFGANFGDLLTKPYNYGGLNLSRIDSTIVLLVLFSITLYMSQKRHYID